MPTYLLKLSGEALGGDAGFGLEPAVLQQLAKDIKALTEQGVALALVLGGGNLFRGQNLAQSGMDRVVGDRMGMLATVMNGLAMGDFLSQAGVPNKLFSSMAIAGVAEGYHRDEVRDLMQQGTVCILSGGTGNPFFTTDTAACLRGVELNVDAVLKATNVDGVYDADPKNNTQARKFDTVSYDEVLQRQLGVMDLTAIVLCKENAMPLVVFDMMAPNVLQDIAAGKSIGTRVVA
ncbi:MAG: UMP kinase [Pseudomonadaceae bacterium]|nr:UMP kinase [Pseudomonadaceae bacterium]